MARGLEINILCLNDVERHGFAFESGFHWEFVACARDGEGEEAFGHFVAPSGEHVDDRLGVGLPGELVV